VCACARACVRVCVVRGSWFVGGKKTRELSTPTPMAEPLRALEPGARACAPNPTLEHRVLGKIALKVRKEVDRQRREPIREQKRMSRIERAAMREASCEEERRRKRKSEPFHAKIDTDMVKVQQCKPKAWSVKVRRSATNPIGKIIMKTHETDPNVRLPKQNVFLERVGSYKIIITPAPIKKHTRTPLHIKGQRATARDRLVPTVLPENEKRKASDADEKEYEYGCPHCGTRHLVKGKKPGPGWDCADGGYVCVRRYNCKLCNRSFFKEGDPSDEYECEDFGKTCRV
jgi:DNA-directed RNA polymerase subunit RPC12/RpoP